MSGSLTIRPATVDDAEAVADILAAAFPGLYRAAFGQMGAEETAWLLAELYRAGHLSLEHTHVALRGERVVGLTILHLGQSIGRGRVRDFWRLMRRQLGGGRALRALFGGLFANTYLNGRIPHAPDLVYIEALAVAEPERGKGIGSLLLEAAAQWARAQGRSRLALHVLQSNTGAQRLYERQGFRLWSLPLPPLFGFLPRRASGHGALLMERHLDTH